MAGESNKNKFNAILLVVSVCLICILTLVHFKVLNYSGMRGKHRLSRLFHERKMIEEAERMTKLQNDLANSSKLADIIHDKHIIKWGKKSATPVISPPHMNKHSAPYIVAQQMNFTEGTYLECGILSGRFVSNTILLEANYNWNGLLVVLPSLGPKIVRREINRKAWVAEVCLSTTKYYTEKKASIEKEIVVPYDGFGESLNGKFVKTTTLECYPLASVILAMNLSSLDYLSLDGFNNQLQILETISFEIFHIKMISVQINYYPDEEGNEIQGEENTYHELMRKNGYIYYHDIEGVESYFKDVIYFHKNLTMQKGVPYKLVPINKSK